MLGQKIKLCEYFQEVMRTIKGRRHGYIPCTHFSPFLKRTGSSKACHFFSTFCQPLRQCSQASYIWLIKRKHWQCFNSEKGIKIYHIALFTHIIEREHHQLIRRQQQGFSLRTKLFMPRLKYFEKCCRFQFF